MTINEIVAYVVIVAVAAFFVFGGLWLEVSTWNECRDTNSFWYCFRIIALR